MTGAAGRKSDLALNAPRTPLILKARRVAGNTLVFRDAQVADAAFILLLRTDSGKSRYLSQTSPEIERQKAWLESYTEQTGQAYFIIETPGGDPLGTVRLYDAQADSFCWGSWILKSGTPRFAAIESVLMVYSYAVNHLGFRAAHFDVRKGNESVWRFHERFGAIRTGETAHDYLYRIDCERIASAAVRYQKYLPEIVTVDP